MKNEHDIICEANLRDILRETNSTIPSLHRFNTVNRDVLWTVLFKLGCLTHFVSIFKELYGNMKAHIVFKVRYLINFQ